MFGLFDSRWARLLLLCSFVLLLAGGGQPTAATAQTDAIGNACTLLLSAEPKATCAAALQALESGQPQLGILIAAGNPTIGTATTQGFRFGARSRLGASAQLNWVLVRLPDIVGEESDGSGAALREQLDVLAPALSGNAAVALLPGMNLSPRVGGVGSVDLLASLTWLPLTVIDAEGFTGRDNPGLTYGVGARVGILRESFTLPGASVSLMYRRLHSLSFGDVCPGTEVPSSLLGIACEVEGDAGEFEFDLTNWSTRVALSRRALGMGLTAGIGYDRFSSNAAFAFRYRNPLNPAETRAQRSPMLDVDNHRWSGFANASFTFLLATLALEGGWMQGGEPVRGFDETESTFNPRNGTFFGSAGVRISF